MSTLRFGLVGIGMMGRNHARVLHAIDGIDLVAIADPAGDKFDARPPRKEKPIDPDSPFAKLAALKEQLKK